MAEESQTWRVGIVGGNPNGLFLAERMRLHPSICLVGAFDPNPDQLKLLISDSCPAWRSIESAATSSEIDVLIFADGYGEDDVAQALRHQRHVVLDRPWQLTAAALRRLDGLAQSVDRSVSVVSYRRRSTTFLAAWEAKARVGPLHSVRYASYEQTLATDPNAAGFLQEFGYDRIEQLLQLVDSTPVRISARQFFDPDSRRDIGFLATIEFASGCTAQIEIQSRSRLSYRTGWMLEGANASFRNQRLYTTAADGEIIDEPAPTPVVTDNDFAQNLIATWQDKAEAARRMTETAQVMRVMELIQQAASSCS